MRFLSKICSSVLALCLGPGLGPGPWVGSMAQECDCTTPAPSFAPTSSPTFGMATHVPSTQKRTIDIQNKCSFDVSLGFTGGFAGPTPCGVNQAGFDDRCFWNFDTLPDLLEAGQTTALQIDAPIAENNVVWSGQIYSIQSPYIHDACHAGCGAHKGPAGTVTLVEFTMLANPTLAYYDVSHVHGANIPTTFGPSFSVENSYRNGVAGGDCSWTFDPPEKYRKYLIEVKGGSGRCDRDDECDFGEVCGASFADDKPVYGTCGQLFGYLNAHTNCIEGSQGYPFYCEIYRDLFACAGQYSESGYSPSVTGSENVCGCSEYTDLGLESSFPCINSNPLWVDKALPWIDYVKRGCVSAYEYAFSDSTSTFTSDSPAFELVLCPADSEEQFYVS